MPVTPPTDEDLARIAARYGFHAGPDRRSFGALAARLLVSYDAALAEVDVLVMPTLPIVATDIPPPGVPREESIARSTEMIVNTAPFDVSGHPATSVPAGWPAGCPGLMIVGRHFGDATVCAPPAPSRRPLAASRPHPVSKGARYAVAAIVSPLTTGVPGPVNTAVAGGIRLCAPVNGR